MASHLVQELEVVYEDYEALDLTVPYQPGFLAFREAPIYVRLLERAKSRDCVPEVCSFIHTDSNSFLSCKEMNIAYLEVRVIYLPCV